MIINERNSTGIPIVWTWSKESGFTIEVGEENTEDFFLLQTKNSIEAREMFVHPFAYRKKVA